MSHASADFLLHGNTHQSTHVGKSEDGRNLHFSVVGSSINAVTGMLSVVVVWDGRGAVGKNEAEERCGCFILDRNHDDGPCIIDLERLLQRLDLKRYQYGNGSCQ